MATKGCNATTSDGYVFHFISRSEAAKWLIAFNRLELQTNSVIRKINAAIREGQEYEGFLWTSAGEGIDYVRDGGEDYSDDYVRPTKKKSQRPQRHSYYDED